MLLHARSLLKAGCLSLVLFLAACGAARQTAPQGASSQAGSSPSGQAAAPAASSQQKVVIKLAHQVSEQNALHKGAVKFKELVERETGGAIEVQIFPAAQLGSEKDMIEGVKMGTIQMAIPSAAALGQFFPPVGVFGMPYIWDGQNEAEEYRNMVKVVRGPVGQELQHQAAQQTGILPLDFAWWYGDRHITNRVRPIQKPDDLKGLKIRTPDAPVNVAPMKVAGATVVPMAFAEVYTALKTGTVDGQENPIAIIYAQKFHEVQKYISLTGHLTQNQVPIINAAFFNKLSPSQQEILRKAIVEAGNYQSQVQIEDNQKYLELMKQQGLQANTVDREAFRAAIAQAVYDQFKNQFGADLYQKIRDAQKR